MIGTALKKGSASQAAMDAAIESMCTLNRAASEAALPFEIHAATDVTGFGLLGHAREMAVGSKVSLAIDSSPDRVSAGGCGVCAREVFFPAA